MSVTATGLLTPIGAELSEFERRLHDCVLADLGPMAEAMEHIVSAGGKRLRPALVILSSMLGEPESPDHVYNLAMGIEFIHTATLVHDDLIDDAETRRGLATIHAILGANPAIIVGDYYFARGANLTSSIGIPLIDTVVSATVMKICMGELLQLISRRDFFQSIEAYDTKIERKTATLLGACTYCGAIVGRLDERRQEALRVYGTLLGMAFQMADDVLDYVATEAQVGKPVGADLRQGTVTLPLMYALDDATVAPRLRDLLGRGELGDPDFAEIVDLVRASDGVERTEERARAFADRARAELAVFDDGQARATLESLCDYVVERRV